MSIIKMVNTARKKRTVFLRTLNDANKVVYKKHTTYLSSSTIHEIKSQINTCEDFGNYYNFDPYKVAWRRLVNLITTEINDSHALQKANCIMATARMEV